MIFVGYEFDKIIHGDKEEPFRSLKANKRIDFITVLFHALGTVARADGSASETEKKVMRGIMDDLQLTEGEILIAEKFYKDEKSSESNLDAALKAFKKNFASNRPLRLQFVKMILKASISGDKRTESVVNKIIEIAAKVGIDAKTVTLEFSKINKELTEIYYRNRNVDK